MSLITDNVKATGTNDAGLAGAVASATTTDLGAVTGNSVVVTGTTTITSLGTASQAGVVRRMIFTDALILTHSSTLICLGEANITTEDGDIAEFLALSTTEWRMVSYCKLGATTNGLIDSDGVASGAITSAKLGDASVIYSKNPTRVPAATSDADSTLTAAEVVTNSVLTLASTVGRNKTTPTAVAIIALLTGYQTGTNFEFTIVQTGAFTSTLIAGVGVTIVGKDTIGTQSSATWLVVVTSPTTVSFIRK